MPIRLKRIYDPAEPEDGFRLLVMRLWPRGVRKEEVSAWEKDLGPSRELLADYKQGRADWREYRRRYHGEMKERRELLGVWSERCASDTVTLICTCEDARFCHRSLLKEILEQRLF